MVSTILENHVFNVINVNVDEYDESMEKSLLSARALWVYRQYGKFDF